jgi:hypothetical protein
MQARASCRSHLLILDQRRQTGPLEQSLKPLDLILRELSALNGHLAKKPSCTKAEAGRSAQKGERSISAVDERA